MTDMTDTSADSPTDAVGPIISMTASIDAPDIQAQQDAFLTENPNEVIKTVKDYNAALEELCRVNAERFAQVVNAGSASFDAYSSYVTEEGVGVDIAVQFLNIMGACDTGDFVARSLAESVRGVVHELVTDPLQAHRRGHIEKIISLESECGELDEEARRDELNNLPTDVLCMMCEPSPVAMDDFADLLFAGLKPQRRPRKGWIARMLGR